MNNGTEIKYNKEQVIQGIEELKQCQKEIYEADMLFYKSIMALASAKGIDLITKEDNGINLYTPEKIMTECREEIGKLVEDVTSKVSLIEGFNGKPEETSNKIQYREYEISNETEEFQAVYGVPKPPKNIGEAQPLYGVPPVTEPEIQPMYGVPPVTEPEIQPMYGVPPVTEPEIQPLYGVPPVTEPEIQPMYGVPPVTEPEIQPMYGVPPITEPEIQPMYGVPPITEPEIQPMYGVIAPPVTEPEIQPMYGVPPITEPEVQIQNELTSQPNLNPEYETIPNTGIPNIIEKNYVSNNPKLIGGLAATIGLFGLPTIISDNIDEKEEEEYNKKKEA